MTDPLLTAPPAVGGAPSGTANQKKFVDLLHDKILKLDQAELDFGLYRILNRRRTDIRAYLEQRLPLILKSAVGGAVEQRQQELQTLLNDLTMQLNTAAKALSLASAFVEGVPVAAMSQFEPAQKYQQTRLELTRLEAQQTLSGSELDQLYLHLLTFFGRYYQGGDYLPTPRRGRDRYLAPYGGQDTLFHWRSRGSHYVKTSTELRSYSYTPTAPEAGGPATIRFELQDAEVEQNNVKGAKRYFVPHPKEASVQAGVLTLPFSYRPLTSAEETKWGGKTKKGADAGEDSDASDTAGGDTGGSVQERLLNDLLSAHPPKGVELAALLKHARKYTLKNTTDFFVHPNLGPFLRRELDAYLLSEYLRPESLQSTEAMQEKFAKYRALREAAGGLIDFLHQLEDFQAQLFEKRKFVLRADYLLPIRLVPTALRSEVLHSPAQLAAWQELFGLGLSGLPEAEQLAALEGHPTLVVDTHHHSEQLKYRLLAEYEDIEASLDGVLVHSENYGALRTLEPTYQERVKLIYIDPPYNTGGDGFLYKDEYSKHSTWLSMMEGRLIESRNLVTPNGFTAISMNEDEYNNLLPLLNQIYPDTFNISPFIWKTRNTDNRVKTKFSVDHEYISLVSKKDVAFSGRVIDRSKYKNPDNDKRGPYTTDPLSGKATQTERPNLHYVIVNLETGDKYAPDPDFGWITDPQGLENLLQDRRIAWPKDIEKGKPRKKRFASESEDFMPISSLGIQSKQADGNGDLINIIGQKIFGFPKPTSTMRQLVSATVYSNSVVFDIFSGSGTLPHAIIDDNYKNDSKNRFVAIEMGEYFDSVMYQRIVKVMFSPDWKDGKPNPMPRFDSLLPALPDWVERSPRLVQVLRLESFEDSLDALELPSERTEREAHLQRLFGADYLLKYMLGSETAGQSVLVSAEAFQNPWAYQLKAGQPVDLPETFNLLLGLKVAQVRELTHGGRRYLLVRGVQHGTNDRVLVLWRDVLGLDAAAEREWLSAQLAALGWAWTDFERVYVNADSALPGAESLDAEFKRRMLVRDEAFRALTGGGAG